MNHCLKFSARYFNLNLSTLPKEKERKEEKPFPLFCKIAVSNAPYYIQLLISFPS